jgi:hypothetical protein
LRFFEACEKCACDLLAGASVSDFEKRRPQPAIKLANNLPADAADCEKAVHGGSYAVEVAFRQEFRRFPVSPAPECAPPPQSGRDIAADCQVAGEFQPG